MMQAAAKRRREIEQVPVRPLLTVFVIALALVSAAVILLPTEAAASALLAITIVAALVMGNILGKALP
jgi:hypothetical protein